MAIRNNSKLKVKNFYTKSYHFFLNKSKRSYSKVIIFIKQKPLISLFLSLLILLLLIIAGNYLSSKKEEVQKPEIVKNVQVYTIGENPKVTLQARTEKSSVIKITALAPGVIQRINFIEGETVNKGAVLISISSNYQGGNAASVQRQLAQKQFQNTKDTLETQKELLKLQKETAEKSESNSSQLRDIINQSLQETRDLIDLNQSILNTLSQNQKDLEQNNPGGINDTTILQIKSQRAQVQLGLNQLRSGLRQSEFQSANDKPPAELASLQKAITIKQLELQQKTLDLGLEVSRLQMVLAQINEAIFFPSSPFSALVQKVHVREGQTVNPGTPLMTLSAIDDPITAVINLPRHLAGSVSSIEPSILHIEKQTIELKPSFISTEATEGTLYNVSYTIPDKYSKDLTDGGYITVEVPVGLSQTTEGVFFVPLDAIYQNADQSIVLVIKDGGAVSKTISLGDVFGRFIEVKSGLSISDQVILNRNILAGDRVSIQKK